MKMTIALCWWDEGPEIRTMLSFCVLTEIQDCLAHSRYSILSGSKSALLKEWNWLKHIKRNLVLLNWIYLLTSVSIFSKIFINCSVVAFTLLSNLQRASACKSLARKPFRGITDYWKFSLRLMENSKLRHWWSSHILSPHLLNKLSQTLDPQLHLFGKMEKLALDHPNTIIGSQLFYLMYPTGATNTSGGLALVKLPATSVNIYLHTRGRH